MSEVILNGDMTKRPLALRRAGRYVLEHLGESLTLDEMARAAGIGRRYLCAPARESSGMGLMDAIGRDRPTQARRLSETTERAIAEICIEGDGNNTGLHYKATFDWATNNPNQIARVAIDLRSGRL
ncbi:MAG: AraC family transcriptional regulator [Chloroflexi bacterium]|nr:MAG: AraC family transcriptional regulator [Chloroflexota bacterium]